ncbi:hypothetical protein MAPG_00081 [Magnaporthiopsis poae ATCC 64411]|uniref:Heterokaryon incompatibility domain-containing protein n=1 Tax=Magnaporthiopsis poae (strain ATCC 64411 / 73-15) TaxID=644358 RepID=A0A0C4DK18_MAGP6|nr:hypothetical protein MAPG_00081 [Magnaporthiopsis poae ATCC 64411]
MPAEAAAAGAAPSTERPGSEGWCHVCRELPLQDSASYGPNARPTDYFIRGEEDKQYRSRPFEWSSCHLRWFIHQLDRRWSGKRVHDLLELRRTCRGEFMAFDQGMPMRVSSVFSGVIHADPLGAPTVGRIRRWIKKCDDEHQSCKAGEVTPLPTRVLDVGASHNTPSDDAVRLWESGGRTGLYLALSHCWGNSQPLTTTTATLGERKSGIPIAKLPKTFSDAVKVARVLGIRYLWIDSLCIVQDSPSDWEIESSKMAAVYKHAYLTIAAVDSSNAEEGFLKPRPFRYMTLKIHSRTDKAQATSIYIKSSQHPPGSRAIQGPLDSRGWALQEFSMSRRVLRFEAESLVWCCDEGEWNEMHLDEANFNYEITDLGMMRLKNIFARPDTQSWRLDGWSHTVRKYTLRKLTFQKDKLPAISGFAAAYAAHTSYTYCAGLWREDIITGLCWRRDRSDDPCEAAAPRAAPASNYVAPSWSWASVSGAVQPPRASLRFAYPTPLDSVAVLNCEVEVIGKNPFGRVGSGRLTLRAPVLPCLPWTADGGPGEEEISPLEIDGFQGINLDFNFRPDSETPVDVKSPLAVVLAESREKPDVVAIACLRSEEYGGLCNPREGGSMLMGIVIEPSSNDALAKPEGGGPVSCFRRVGYFDSITLPSSVAEAALEKAVSREVVIV